MISHLNNFLSRGTRNPLDIHHRYHSRLLALAFIPVEGEAGTSLLEIVSIQDLGVKTFLRSLPSVLR